MNQVKVSIIVPVFNVERYLLRCLESLLAQSEKAIEVVCVDDGSEDNSAGILKKLQQRDNRLHIVSQPNQGAGFARNTGMSIAQGEYILFVDADDYVDQYLVERVYRRAVTERADICLFDAKGISPENGKKQDWFHALRADFLQNFETVTYKDLPKHIFQITVTAPWGKLIKRQLLRDHALTFPHYKTGQDIVVSMLALVFAQKITWLNERLYFYTIEQESSISKKVSPASCEPFFALQELQGRLVAENKFNDVSQSFMVLCLEKGFYLLDSSPTVSVFIKRYYLLQHLILSLNTTGYTQEIFMNENYYQRAKIIAKKDPVSYLFATRTNDLAHQLLLQKTSTELQTISRSFSYKIGLCITCLPRLLKEFLRRCR